MFSGCSIGDGGIVVRRQQQWRRRQRRKTPQTACATIGHAISLAASGDTIKIAAATHQENLSIPFKLTLTGANAATTIVDGTNTANVFTVGAGISPYFLRTQCKLRRHRQSQLDDNHDLDLLQQLREQ